MCIGQASERSELNPTWPLVAFSTCLISGFVRAFQPPHRMSEQGYYAIKISNSGPAICTTYDDAVDLIRQFPGCYSARWFATQTETEDWLELPWDPAEGRSLYMCCRRVLTYLPVFRSNSSSATWNKQPGARCHLRYESSWYGHGR